MSDYQPDEALAENYRARAKEMGVDLDHLAPMYERHDPKLAAWMRGQAKPSAKSAPKGRSAPGKADG